jgi:hypothetical protein
MFGYRLHLCFLLFAILALLFCGCMPDGYSLTGQARKQLYIDANLLFEVSYPEEWALSQQPMTLRPLAKETTIWRISHKNDNIYPLVLSILSLSKERNSNGYKGLEELILEQNGDLIITTRNLISLPVGPVQKLVGATPDESFEIWFHLGEKRHYIISCSAATSDFELYRLQFRQIADSFMVIE